MKSRSFSVGEFKDSTELWLKLRRLQECPIYGERLTKILAFFISALASGTKMVTAATTEEDWKLIDCYLEINLIVLDACDAIKQKLQSTRTQLRSLDIALHCLDGEHEPGRTVLNRAVVALESGDFRDKQCCIKLEECFSRLRTLGKKMDYLGDGTSHELCKLLNSSWAMSVLAVGVLGSATCSPGIQFPNTDDSWAVLRDRKKKRREDERSATMVELTGTALAAETVLKLVSDWQKNGRPLEIKEAVGELRKRKEELEKTMQPLDEKIGELHRELLRLRMGALALISSARPGEGAMDLSWTPGPRSTELEKSMKKLYLMLDLKRNRPAFLSQIGRIGSFLGLNLATRVKPILC